MKNKFNINQKIIFFDSLYSINKGIIIGINGIEKITYQLKLNDESIHENVAEYKIFENTDKLLECVNFQINNIEKTNNGQINDI